MRKQTKLWTTKDGRRIRICDMEDDHLLHTIRLLQRVAETKRIKSVVFYTTCEQPTSDGALDCFNREFDSVMDAELEDYLPRIYENLGAEVNRRGLELPIQQRRIDIECKLIMARFEEFN